MATRVFANPVSASSLAIASPERRFTRAAYGSTRAPSQPHRRGRPVVAPNPAPTFRSRSPVASVSSVGKGPLPTRVVYALVMPITEWIDVGPSPAPTAAFPATVFEEVT